MKILIICSYKKQYENHITPFIKEQVDALIDAGMNVDYFLITGKGIRGYLSNLKLLKNKIKSFQPDIIHAHFGLSGLFANLQRKVPVVTTYHGSDINNNKVFCYSLISIFLSQSNIFVSQANINKVKAKKKYALIPCGINMTEFQPLKKIESRQKFGFLNSEKIILFSGSFDVFVKNAPLAKLVVNMLHDVRLIELKGCTRSQVCELMSASDVVLMTSFSEGSPQFIKEALACNCPIVSVDVGDVKNLILGVQGCYITSYDPKDIADTINKVFEENKRTNGRDFISQFDNNIVVKKIIEVYNAVLK